MNFLHSSLQGFAHTIPSDGNIFPSSPVLNQSICLSSFLANKTLLEIVGIQSQGHTLIYGLPILLCCFPRFTVRGGHTALLGQWRLRGVLLAGMTPARQQVCVLPPPPEALQL